MGIVDSIDRSLCKEEIPVLLSSGVDANSAPPLATTFCEANTACLNRTGDARGIHSPDRGATGEAVGEARGAASADWSLLLGPVGSEFVNFDEPLDDFTALRDLSAGSTLAAGALPRGDGRGDT